MLNFSETKLTGLVRTDIKQIQMGHTMQFFSPPLDSLPFWCNQVSSWLSLNNKEGKSFLVEAVAVYLWDTELWENVKHCKIHVRFWSYFAPRLQMF